MRKRKKEEPINEAIVSLTKLNEELEELQTLCFTENKEMIARHTIRNLIGYEFWPNMHEESIITIDEEETRIDSEIERHNEFMEAQRKELEFTKQELERAKKNVAVIERNLDNAKIFHNNLEAEKAELEETRDVIFKLDSKLTMIVLLHQSAEEMKRSVNQFQLGIMVVNECDNMGYIKDVVKPDIVVKQADLIKFYLNVPYDFENKYNEKQKESIISYCNLVVNVVSHLDGENYSRIKLLYCNEDIARILKMNGVLQ